MAERVESVDDLGYDWPPDVLHYETRYFLGLTINEMIMLALPALGLTLLVGILAGAAAALLGLLALKRFEALGGRSLPLYLIARLRHARRRQAVMLPLILPKGEGELVITTWDDEEMVRIGGR